MSAIKVVYVAGPFSGKDGWEVAENVHRAERLAREVTRLGAAPLTPHSIGARMDGTETCEFWVAATLEMMRRCDAVVLTDDWERSAGARGEVDDAGRHGIPVLYTLPDLARWLRNTPRDGVAEADRCDYTDLTGVFRCRERRGHEGWSHPVASDIPGRDNALVGAFVLAPEAAAKARASVEISRKAWQALRLAMRPACCAAMDCVDHDVRYSVLHGAWAIDDLLCAFCPWCGTRLPDTRATQRLHDAERVQLTEAEARVWAESHLSEQQDTCDTIEEELHLLSRTILAAARGEIPLDVRPARHHAAEPGETCAPCSEALESPSPCALSHDAGPGAYRP